MLTKAQKANRKAGNIIIIGGQLGAGKTAAGAAMVYGMVKANRYKAEDVFSNTPLFLFDDDEYNYLQDDKQIIDVLNKLDDDSMADKLIFIDEIDALLGSGTSRTVSVRILGYRMGQTRKQGTTIILCGHDLDDIALPIKRFTTVLCEPEIDELRNTLTIHRRFVQNFRINMTPADMRKARETLVLNNFSEYCDAGFDSFVIHKHDEKLQKQLMGNDLNDD